MKTYHVALIKGMGREIYPLHRNGHRTGTLVIQMRRNLDYLSPDTWIYYGQRETTKARIEKMKHQIMAQVNAEHPTASGRPLFDRVVVD